MVAALTLLGAVSAPEAQAEIEFNWGGHIKSDLRFRIEEKRTGGAYDEYVLPVGVSRNENAAKLKMDVVSGGWAGVLDLDFVFVGISEDVQTLGNMSLRGDVDPYRVEAHALFIEALDLFEGFDMRIGYQKLLWGVGDQFNPTNNLNADDMEDELLFGDQQANAMIRLDWTPIDEISMTAALVPVFRPSLLPPSGRLALAATDRLPMDDGPTRRRIVAEQNLTTSNGYPTVVQEIHVKTPDLALDNMQAGFQFATLLGEHDLAFNYFIGHHDVPVPVLNHTVQHENTIEGSAACPPWWREMQDDPTVQQETPPACLLRTETTVEFPRMQTVGLNMAGEVDLLGWISDGIHPIGYRFELGVFFPEEKRLTMTQGELVVTLPSGIPLTLPAGEYDYAGTVIEEVVGATGAPMEAQPPVVLPDTPFAKWSLGIDYSFGSHVYLNMQWVHGLADEFGAGDWITEGYAVRSSWIDAEENDAFQCGLPASIGGLGSGRTCATEMLRPRLGDYLVLGLDFKFLNDAALLRLFTMWDLTGLVQERWDEESQSRVRTAFHPFTDEAFSAVIYPSFSYNFGFGLTLTAGALLKFGKAWTKFGDPAAGGSVVWSSAKFAF
jgi:hypothetical protein